MEAGGPMGRMRTKQSGVGNGNEKDVIDGEEPGVDGDKTSQLPHSGSYMASGVGRELSAEKYAKRKGVPTSAEKDSSGSDV